MNHILPVGFEFTPEIVYPDGRVVRGDTVPNIIPQAGVDFIAGLLRGTATPIANWYVGIYAGNFTPTSTFTAADLQTSAAESQAYTEALRPTWSHAYDGVSMIDNVTARAEFTMDANATIYGGFLVSASAKGGNTGLVLSIARFSTPQVLVSGAVFRVSAGIALVPTNVI